MKYSKFMRFSIVVLLLSFFGCGIDLDGDYKGIVDGKEIILKFLPNGEALVQGYFPDDLSGVWVEEKMFGDPQIWVTFDGPEEKPFRLRFELKPHGQDLHLIGIKARPLGKGTKLNPINIEGIPIFKPLSLEQSINKRKS